MRLKELDNMHVYDSSRAWCVCGAPGSGATVYPEGVNGHFGVHSSVVDALLTLEPE